MSPPSTYSYVFSLPAGIDETFQLFADPALLDTLTPSWFSLKPSRGFSLPLAPGSEIPYRLRWRGLPLHWISRIVDWQQETEDPTEFMSNLKVDLDQDEVFVFTPKGKVIELPVGATPVDFGYTIHTDVGHTCIGSKVNDRLVPLDTRLESGDKVEILTSKVDGAGPSRDWLKFVASRRASKSL